VLIFDTFSSGLPNFTSSSYPLGRLFGSDAVLPLPYNAAKSWGVPYDLPVSNGSFPSSVT